MNKSVLRVAVAVLVGVVVGLLALVVIMLVNNNVDGSTVSEGWAGLVGLLAGFISFASGRTEV